MPNRYKNKIDLIKALVQTYSESQSPNVKTNAAKKLLLILLDAGYDIGYTKKDGSKVSGSKAIDGKLGDATMSSLNQYVSFLNLAGDDSYDLDYKKKYGKEPLFSKVAGRDLLTTKDLTRAYYSYYKNNPTMYSSLINSNKAADILPYLNNEALSMLSEYYIEPYRDENTGRGIGLPTLAYNKMLGQRGIDLLRLWELLNVRDALLRGAENLNLQAYDILGAGQRVMGLITGTPDAWKAGGLTYDYVYNPVTNLIQLVVVPNQTQTVADNIHTFLGNHPTIQNGLNSTVGTVFPGLQRMVNTKEGLALVDLAINTVTDPITWLSSAAAGDWAPEEKITYPTGSYEGSSYKGVMGETPFTNGQATIADINVGPTEISSGVAYGPGRYIEGKPVYLTLGNLAHPRGKHGGVNNVVATSTPTKIYEADPYPYLIESTPIDINVLQEPLTFYQAERPSMYAIGERRPYEYYPGFAPIIVGPSRLSLPPRLNYVEDTPDESLYNWQYTVDASTAPDALGRAFTVTSPEEELKYVGPSSNTLVPIRSRTPYSGLFPRYYRDLLSELGENE